MTNDTSRRTPSASGGSGGNTGRTAIERDAEELRRQVRREGEALGEKLTEGREAVEREARSAAAAARDRAVEYAEQQKSAASESLDTFAQAVRRASDELSQRDQTMAASLVRQAAGSLESLSRSLSSAGFGDLVDSVRDFGRRNPAAFIGGAVLAGMAMGRFARSSGGRRHEAAHDMGGRMAEGAYGGAGAGGERSGRRPSYRSSWMDDAEIAERMSEASSQPAGRSRSSSGGASRSSSLSDSEIGDKMGEAASIRPRSSAPRPGASPAGAFGTTSTSKGTGAGGAASSGLNPGGGLGGTSSAKPPSGGPGSSNPRSTGGSNDRSR